MRCSPGLMLGSNMGGGRGTRRCRGFCLARGAALFLAVGLLYATIQRIPLTTGLTLFFIEPFVLTLLCWFFLKEKISRVQWAAIAVGFVGVVIAIKPVVAPFDVAYITGLGSGVFYAVFLFLTRYIEGKTPPIVSVFHTGLVGAAVASLIVFFSWRTPAVWEWSLLMFAGGVAAIAHIFNYQVVRENRRFGDCALYLQRDCDGGDFGLFGFWRPPGQLAGGRLRADCGVRNYRRAA